MPDLSRRNVLGASLSSTAALVAGTAAAASKSNHRPSSQKNFKSTGEDSMSLEEFRTLNGPGSVGRLIGEMDCDLLASCHKDMKKRHGVWIPELVPVFNQIDAGALPRNS